ncbi:MAG TPA: hypothetical protein VFK94_06840, partial [Patescibacteria group bacterium]|nr:hypothetical protein [Patescibacteria group bacterium]
QPEDELYRVLASLQNKEFLYEQPAFPEVEYIFKHALTQEVAYGTVLQERRKLLHEQTARATEHLYHDHLEEHYGELAHHYSRGNNSEKAIEYLYKAGQQAGQRSATAEAITHLTTALELLKVRPDTPNAAQQELALQIALGAPLIAAKGWAAPETVHVYTRARELCQQVGGDHQLFSVLVGLWFVYYARVEVQIAHDLSEQCLSLAGSRQDPALLLEAHAIRGWNLYIPGEFVQAQEHFAQGLALYDSQQHRSLASLYGGFDPGASCMAYTAYTLWLLGYPEQALKSIHAAVTLAQELVHPFSLAMALNWATIAHQFRREGQMVQERAEAAIALSIEQGFPFCVAWGTILRGWALAEERQREEGITQIRQGIAAWQATGVEVWRPYFLALLVEGHEKAEQPEEGLRVLAEALRAVEKTGERWWEAELYRIKGELTLRSRVQGPKFQVEEEAEQCFHKAVAIARQQHAKSLELRATMSLARLWQSHGKTAEAHRMLSEIYHWFTEGFDTKDLQEAKALLQKLATNRE